MNQIKFLSITLALICTLQIGYSQMSESELKSELITNLIKTNIYLTEASNGNLNTESKILLHSMAVKSYGMFDKYYSQLEPKLNAEIIANLSLIQNVYGQVAKSENYRYLSDKQTITALEVCSLKVSKTVELIVK